MLAGQFRIRRKKEFTRLTTAIISFWPFAVNETTFECYVLLKPFIQAYITQSYILAEAVAFVYKELEFIHSFHLFDNHVEVIPDWDHQLSTRSAWNMLLLPWTLTIFAVADE